MAEAIEQETDTLIMLEVAHVHRHRAVASTPAGNNFGSLSVSAWDGSAASRVVSSTRPMAYRVRAVGHILQRGTDGEHSQAAPYRDRLTPSHGGEAN